MAHVILWEFQIQPAAQAEFERMYGPQGDWVRLFAKGKGYQGTELLSDTEAAGRYVVIDRWESAADFQAFKQQFQVEYKALDIAGEGLTLTEKPLGCFFRVS